MAYDSIQLLQAFDSAIRSELVPYFETPGIHYTSGESSFDGYRKPSTLRKCEFSKFKGSFFLWIHRFAFEETVFDVSYGDREFIVETTIYYGGISARFAPWELLLAAKVPDPHTMSGNTWVLTSEFMARTIASIAAGISKYWPLLSRPTPELVDRAQELRGRRLIFAQDEQRKRDREHACFLASRAFHENRLDEAIQLLAPFRNDEQLAPSSRLLLKKAEAQKQ